MRVLIFSQHFWPETFRINEVAQSLRDAGCEVSILTGQPNYPDGHIYPGYRAFSTRRQDFCGMPLVRVPLIPRGKAGAIRLIANYLSFIVAASLLGPWLLRGRRFDVIFVYGNSPILQVIGARVLRRFTGGALVPWVQDLWPQSLEVTGYVRNRRLLAAVEVVVRWIYRGSDLLLVQSRSFIATVSALAGKTPVEYHPNPGDAAFTAAQPEAGPLTLPAGFNVVFAGNLGTAQALDAIVGAAALLTDLPAVKIVLVGSGSRSSWLQEEVRSRGLTNVLLPGRFAPESMPGILRQASVLLVSLVRDPTMSQTIPSKVQTYLAAGRPIIAALEGEGAQVVEEAGAGVVCRPQDPEAIAAAIRNLHASRSDDLVAMGDRGRAYYAQYFEPAMLAHRLKDRFEKLAGGRAVHG
jgi:glycosyltransferase involved in cell wall biosynthesis